MYKVSAEPQMPQVLSLSQMLFNYFLIGGNFRNCSCLFPFLSIGVQQLSQVPFIVIELGSNNDPLFLLIFRLPNVVELPPQKEEVYR